MVQSVTKYHEAALGYLQEYYLQFADESFYFGYPFITRLADEAFAIAKAERVEAMEFENALVAVIFRFAGVTNVLAEDDTWLKLLHDFMGQINYPKTDAAAVENIIQKNIAYEYPSTNAERVAWDAIAYRFAIEDLIVHVSFLKEEMNRLHDKNFSELEILTGFKQHALRSNFVTPYANEQYTEKKEKNFIRLTKRIEKLSLAENKNSKENPKPTINLSDKETEDLFKIAFRNYVHLVSVADSKAGLLINVNSIIISVVIAFAVSRSEKYPFLVTPSFILLSVAFITILLSILASRPQGNRLIQDRESKSYQTFFFGSFDLIGRDFLKADWNNYHAELYTLLKGGKENVYEEMYKEAFNVRKVLGKKFSYLSVAYWTFIVGLFISILSFFISTYKG